MCTYYRIAGNFRGQAGLHKVFPHRNVGVAYCNACNAVYAMNLNEIYTHENHRFPVKRIFFPTKITRYRVINFIMLVLSVPAYLLSESLCSSEEVWGGGVGGGG